MRICAQTCITLSVLSSIPLYLFYNQSKPIMAKIKEVIQGAFNLLGYKVIRHDKNDNLPKDMDEDFRDVYKKCKPYTMTSIEGMYSLYKAVKYVVNSKIPGDFVECGVWRGGSAMIIARTLIKMKDTNRKIYLYDTFEGMPKPAKEDKSISENKPAIKIWEKNKGKNFNKWCLATIGEVKENMFSTKYPKGNLVFLKGKVENTIPNTTPSKIALLRLDTDWHASTYHELIHLFPLLSNKGVLIIDDYGSWAGSKKAVDRYTKENKIPILLNRINSGNRLGIKLGTVRSTSKRSKN